MSALAGVEVGFVGIGVMGGIDFPELAEAVERMGAKKVVLVLSDVAAQNAERRMGNPVILENRVSELGEERRKLEYLSEIVERVSTCNVVFCDVSSLTADCIARLGAKVVVYMPDVDTHSHNFAYVVAYGSPQSILFANSRMQRQTFYGGDGQPLLLGPSYGLGYCNLSRVNEIRAAREEREVCREEFFESHLVENRQAKIFIYWGKNREARDRALTRFKDPYVLCVLREEKEDTNPNVVEISGYNLDHAIGLSDGVIFEEMPSHREKADLLLAGVPICVLQKHPDRLDLFDEKITFCDGDTEVTFIQGETASLDERLFQFGYTVQAWKERLKEVIREVSHVFIDDSFSSTPPGGAVSTAK